MELLAARKADPSAVVLTAAQTGEQPLHGAAYSGAVAIAEQLVARGAEVIATVGGDGRRPLHVAAQSGHAQLVEYLAARKAEARAEAGPRPGE